MSKYCKIKGYECGFSLGENRCVMDMPCTDIAEWIAEHDKQLLEDLNEFLVEEKGEYVGSDINEFLAIRKG